MRDAALLFCLFALPVFAADVVSDVGDDYRWDNMPIGGGGYVTAICPHPTQPGTLLVGSDMTGPFIRHAPNERFVDAAQRNLQMKGGVMINAVSDIAIHPHRPDVVWTCVRGPGLMRSRDGGLTFAAVHPVRSFQKYHGPSIALDPANPDVIYRGTSHDGLFRSMQSGDAETWERVTVVAGQDQVEHLVAFAPTGPTANGRSQVLYVHVAGVGLHVSRDGGETFALLDRRAGPAAAPEESSERGPVNLAAFASFAQGLGPWQGRNGPWELRKVEVTAIDERAILRIPAGAGIIEVVRDIDPAWGPVTLRAALRATGIVPGERAHEASFIEINFFDAANTRLLGWRAGNFQRAATDGWHNLQREYAIPDGAVRMVLSVGNLAREGVLELACPEVVVPRAPATAATPRAVAADAPANPRALREIRIAADGSVYAVTPKQLLRFRDSEGWTDVSPHFPGDHLLHGLAIHPHHAEHLVLSYRWEIFRSRDGGATWDGPLRDERRGGTMRRAGTPGWFDKPVNAAPTFLAFDPHAPSRLYLSDAYMFWQCDDIWAEAPVFTAQWRGIENVAVIDLAVPARDDGHGTVLLAALADVRGLRWTSTTEAPTEKLAQAIMNTDGKGGDDASSVATSEQHPQRWYMAMNRGWRGPSYALRSDNGGQTWAWMTNPIPDADNHGGAKIAVSATNPDVLVYAPGNTLTARVSHDGGQTWNEVQGLPWLSGVNRNFNNDNYIAADTVDGATFYAIRPDGSDDGLYVSRDRGLTWARGGGALPKRTGHGGHDLFPIHLAAKPGAAGVVVASIGREGVFRTDDFGASFQRLDEFQPNDCGFVWAHHERYPLHMATRPHGGVGNSVAWGAPAPDTDQPTLYVMNTLRRTDHRALYRSMDDGATWARISRDDFHVLNPAIMVACRQNFGRVFISDGGRGVVVAEPLSR